MIFHCRSYLTFPSLLFLSTWGFQFSLFVSVPAFAFVLMLQTMTHVCQALPHLLLSFGIVILCYACGCITMVRCVTYSHENSVWPWPLASISKLYFHNEFWIWQDVFALWHRHTKLLHMGVLPWDMCTFSTLVWLWPLTYMWVAGVILKHSVSWKTCENNCTCKFCKCCISCQTKCTCPCRLKSLDEILLSYL